MIDLMPHQKQCLASGNQSHAFFLEMGLGKTRIMLELISHDPCKVLVCVPASGVEDTWINEVAKWRDDINIKSTIKQTPAKRAEIRNNFQAVSCDSPTILLFNYEQSPEVAAWLTHNNIIVDMAIADESTYIKSHKSQRTQGMTGYWHTKRKKRIKGVRDFAKRAYILTGTPVLQGPLDLYSQMQFVSPEILKENFYAFRNRYTIMKPITKKKVMLDGSIRTMQIDIVDSYKNLDHLMKRIQPYVTSIKKEDVAIDLPPKIYVKRYVELSPKERKNYKLIKEGIIYSLADQDYIPIVNALAKLGKLMQAACGFNYHQSGFEKREVMEYGKSKRNAAVELIVNGDLSGHPCVIWAVFKHEVEMLTAELLKTKVKVVSEYTSGTATDAVKEFLDGKADVLIINPQSMSHGINLQRASVEIFLSNSFKYGDREQAEARCHRMGQKNPVTIVDIVAKDTVDDKILKVLAKKGDMADMITEELGVKVHG